MALDLTSAEGLDILYRLAATCDLFLTNKLPSVRKKLKIEVDDIRAANPRIIYVRGTGQGERGPDADKGSYDSLAFWMRAGIAVASKREEYATVPSPPAPGFGDSIGAMTIAGGIMGALFHRERTGEATTVDVSLLGTGCGRWARRWPCRSSWTFPGPHRRPTGSGPIRSSPRIRPRTTGGCRSVCLQAGRYWAPMCEVIGRPELATDPRFADHASLLANSGDAIEILGEVFAERTLDEWRERLEGFIGQWTVVQDTLETAVDPQTIANGYVQECETAAGVPFRLAAAPVQFGDEPAVPRRAPEFNEHGDAILTELGLDWDTIVDLKVRGVVA